MTKPKSDAPKPKNPAAQSLGRLGGSRNSDDQNKARAENSKRAGRPRRICTTCGEPCHGGHKKASLNTTCDGHTWQWQTPRERRAAEAAKRAAKKKPAA